MKIYQTTHRGLDYRFELFESVEEIWVWKDGTHVYTLRKISKGWRCNCPSGHYRKYCWHLDTVPAVLLTPSSTDLVSEWNEEAAQIRREVEINTGGYVE